MKFERGHVVYFKKAKLGTTHKQETGEFAGGFGCGVFLGQVPDGKILTAYHVEKLLLAIGFVSMNEIVRCQGERGLKKLLKQIKATPGKKAKKRWYHWFFPPETEMPKIPDGVKSEKIDKAPIVRPSPPKLVDPRGRPLN